MRVFLFVRRGLVKTAFAALCAIAVYSINLHALLPKTAIQENILLTSSEDPSSYQIGDEWGKFQVIEKSLDTHNEIFKKAAMRTAKFKRSTAFYIGKFKGQHVMATNYHVLRNQWTCSGQIIDFQLLNAKASCDKYLGSWSEVDFALFTIKVTDPSLEEALPTIAQNLAFNLPVYKGQKLLSFGYGIANNPDQVLSAVQDSDCKSFSSQDEVRLLQDPDVINPQDYSAWSFANGCDMSHGDSGSALIDRETGDIIGIIWTTKIPKSENIKDSAYLQHLYDSNSEEVWQELSYGVPSILIYHHLNQYVANTEPSEKVDIINAVLWNKTDQ